MLLVGYFVFLLIVGQDNPLLIGPYSREECWAVEEAYQLRGYETCGCELMAVPAVLDRPPL